MTVLTRILVCIAFAWTATACVEGIFNAGDPTSREWMETRVLECLVDPNCPAAIQVPVLAEGVTRTHMGLVLPDGRVRIWGENTDGRLGFNNTIDVGDGAGPTIIAAGDVPVGGTAALLSTGTVHSCALLVGGTVRCWGLGTRGRLGYDSTATLGDGIGSSIIAAGDVPVGGTVVKVAAGNEHVCALLDSGSVRCWGPGSNGRLGYGNTNDVGSGTTSIIAAGDVPLGGTATDIVPGNGFTCAILSGGNLRCWGLNSGGQLGYGNTTSVGDGIGPAITAAGNVAVGGTVLQVASGSSHACALLAGGTVRCWGTGGSGRLGYNGTSNVGDGVGPSIVTAGDVLVGGTVIGISVGNSHTCALLAGGSVRCWGENGQGQLGYGNTTNVGDGTGPTIIVAGDVPLGGIAVQVVAGRNSSCAVLDDASVRCWGQGLNGRLGYNSTANVGDGVGLSIIAAGNVPYE